MSYRGVTPVYDQIFLGRRGEVVIPSSVTVVETHGKPARAGGHSWRNPQAPAHLLGRAIRLDVVALETAGNQVFPGLFTPARFRYHVVNCVCVLAAISAVMTIPPQHSSAGEGNAACIGNSNIA